MLASETDITFPVLAFDLPYQNDGFPERNDLLHCMAYRIKEGWPVGKLIADSAGRQFRTLSVIRGDRIPELGRGLLARLWRALGFGAGMDLYAIDLELEELPRLSFPEVRNMAVAVEAQTSATLFESFEEDPEYKAHLVDVARTARSGRSSSSSTSATGGEPSVSQNLTTA